MRVFVPAPFRYKGVDYPYGYQDLPDALGDVLLAGNLIRATTPAASASASIPGVVGSSTALWFPFTTDRGQDRLVDRSVNLALTNGGTALTFAGASPMVTFNGNGYLQADQTVMTLIQRSIFRLDTLAADEMFVMWCDITHPTTFAAGQASLFYWGKNATQGWGISYTGTTGRLMFDHVSQSGNRQQFTFDPNFQLAIDGVNTRTALCLTISRANVDCGGIGKGNGLFEIEVSKRGITNQGPFTQRNFTRVTPERVPNIGVAPCKFDSVVGLTIGARPTTGLATNADNMPAGYGLNSIGFARRKRQCAFPLVVTRQLTRLIALGQAQNTMPAACAN